jgi:hypothetical protein
MKLKNLAIILTLILSKNAFTQVNDNCNPLSPFHRIQIYDGIEVTLEKGEGYYICAGANTKLEDLTVALEDTTLRIRRIAGNKYEKTPAIKIVFKELSAIEGYSKANIDSKNLIQGNSVSVILKSGATLYASFDVKYLYADIIEGCLFKADGYANIQKIEVDSKATFSGFELEGQEAEVKVTTGGKAKVNIEKILKASATSGGFVNYKGTPMLEQKASLGGKIVSEVE